MGVLTVLGLYFLTREIFNEKIALLSSFFISTSFWHVNFSRIGFRAILVPLILVWGFFILFRALKEKKWLFWLISAIIFGLGFYTYIAYKIAPLIIFLVLILQSFQKKDFLRKNYLFIIIFILVLGLMYFPLYQYFKNNPSVGIRTGQVSVLNPEVNKGNLIGTLTKTSLLGLGMFNFYGDPNWRHNFSTWPILNLLVGIAFLGGIVLIIKNFFTDKKNRVTYLFLIIWFGAMLLPAVLTEEGMPHSLRAIGVLPVPFIFAALFINYLISKINFRKTFFVILTALFLAIIPVTDFGEYFLLWAKRPEVSGQFNENYVNIANYLNGLPSNIQKFVVSNQSGVEVNGWPVPVQTIEFMTYNKSEVKYLLPDDLNKINFASNSVIAFMVFDKKLIEDLEIIYPNGNLLHLDLKPGSASDFFVYHIS